MARSAACHPPKPPKGEGNSKNVVFLFLIKAKSRRSNRSGNA